MKSETTKFKEWVSKNHPDEDQDEIAQAAILNSIPGYAGSGEDAFWLRKRVLDYFPDSHDIRRGLLRDMAVKKALGGRNAVEYIKTFNQPKGPTFQQLVNWLSQKQDLTS